MAETNGRGGRVAIGAVAGAAVVAMILWWAGRYGDVEQAVVGETQPVAQGGDIAPAATESVVAEDPDPDVDPDAEAAPESAEAGTSSEADRIAAALGFDLVRVEPDGSAIIAGRALPNSLVTILQDGTAIGEVQSDGTGAFAAFLDLASAAEASVLTLATAGPDGARVVSQAQVIVTAPVQVAQAEPSSGEDEAQKMAPLPREDTQPAEAVEAALTPEVDGAAAEANGGIQESVAEVADTPDPTAQAESSLTETGQTAPDSARGEGAAVAAAGNMPPEDTVETASADAPITSADADLPEPLAQEGTAPDAGTATATASDNTPMGQIAADTAEAIGSDTPARIAADTEDRTASGTSAPSATGPFEQPATAAPEPTAPAVILSDADGVRVLQSGRAPEVTSDVLLDSITYSDVGTVALAGRGAASDGFVRVYLDNRPIITSRIKADGNWRTELPNVDSGIYTLRVDQIDAAGTVTSRVETPFLREDEERVAEALAAAALRASEAQSAATPTPVTSEMPADPGADAVGIKPPVPQAQTDVGQALAIPSASAPAASTPEAPASGAVANRSPASPSASALADQPRQIVRKLETVQPGSTLWAIARNNYGQGVMYLRIFEANKTQIRNPDLIYPGQVFEVPE